MLFRRGRSAMNNGLAVERGEALHEILKRTPMESMMISKKQASLVISNLLKQFA
jgi:hypothetical protein